MSGFHSRGDIIGPDGLSRLTLGQAVWGERAKGVTDPVAIARNLVELYRAEWLAREMRKSRREVPKLAYSVFEVLLAQS